MNDVVAQLEGVSKAYEKIQALKGLTLAIPRGSVVGLLGRNAAGKSTALRCLVGLERADAGTVTVLGQDPRKLDVAARQRFTFLSEQGVPFPAASAADLVKLCSPLYPLWNRELELPMTPAVVQLLYREALREALLGLSWLCVIPLWSSVSRATPTIRFIIGGLTLAVLASILAYYALLFTSFLWPLPPLWLAAFFAVASGTLFFRQVLASHS